MAQRFTECVNFAAKASLHQLAGEFRGPLDNSTGSTRSGGHVTLAKATCAQATHAKAGLIPGGCVRRYRQCHGATATFLFTLTYLHPLGAVANCPQQRGRDIFSVAAHVAVPGSCNLRSFDLRKQVGLRLWAEGGPRAPRRLAAIDCAMGFSDCMPRPTG